VTDLKDEILASLQQAAAQRALRQAEPRRHASVEALKRFQSLRFERTYHDLSAQPRYRAATGFFLQELYGPRDFAMRDAQFAQIVPTLVKLFAGDVADTVRWLARLHGLSEELDTLMAQSCDWPAAWALPSYRTAWQQVGRADQRREQIALLMRVGQALDGYTRTPMLLRTLKAMRLPARLAGLQDLQRFLECGFEAFRAMQGAQTFLAIIEERETALAARLYAPPGDSMADLLDMAAWFPDAAVRTTCP
jgi:hypothetical protein